MKKLLFVAAVASAFGLFAADEGVQDGTQVLEVGITKITSSLKNTVIAISYESLKGGAATADHLVKTTNLTPQDDDNDQAGDKLVAFKDGKYHTWTLKTEKGVNVWEPDLVEISAGVYDFDREPATYPVDYGSGIWLTRNGDLAKPFYIYGKPSTAKSIDVPAGTTVLVGNPTTSNKAPKIDNPQPGDTILIPSATIPTQVKCALVDKKDPTKGVKWGGFGIKEIPAINANTGFWYISAAEGDTRTISWQ